MPHFMIVLIFFKPFFDNKISIFEEYGPVSPEIQTRVVRRQRSLLERDDQIRKQSLNIKD